MAGGLRLGTKASLQSLELICHCAAEDTPCKEHPHQQVQ